MGLLGAYEQLTAHLEEAAKEALHQINQKRYLAEVEKRGCTHILKIGIAFCGKRFKMQAEQTGKN